MKKIFTLFFLFVVCLQSSAQNAKKSIPDLSKYYSKAAQINALADACDSLSNIEKFMEMRTVAEYGLQIIPSNDFDNLSLFSAYVGASVSDISKDSAIYFMEQSLSYARKGQNSRRICVALERLLSWYNYTNGYTDKRDKTAKEIKTIIDTTKSDETKSRMYNALSGYYGQLGLYETQLKYQLANLDAKTKLIKEGRYTAADSGNYGVSFIAVGQTYLHMKQPIKAMDYTQQARPYIYGYLRALIHYYRDLVDANLQLQQPAIAKQYYDSLTNLQVEEPYEPVKWYGRIVMDLYFAEYFATLQDLNNALVYAQRARLLAPQYADDFLMPQVNQTLGAVHVARKEFSKALPLLQAAEDSFAGQSIDLYKSLLQTLAQCYQGLGKWEQAAQYYSKYIPLSDSLYAEGMLKNLTEAEAKYQNKHKQSQIDAQQTKLAYAAKQRLWLIAGMVLLLVVATLLVIIYRNKKRTADVMNRQNKVLGKLNNDLEEANHTKAKLFGIISHDLRSPISQVYQFLKLQQMAPERLNEEQRNNLSNKIQSATGSLLETMEDLLLWSKTQMNQFNTDMQPVAIDEVVAETMQLLQLNIEAKNIDVSNQLSSEIIVKSDPYFLQTILRNLLQNAIKATPQNGSIKISFVAHQLVIENEGGHFSQQQYEQVLASKEDANSLSGLGLRLVDELSRKINAQITFASATNDTTVAHIKFDAAQ